MKKGKILVVDDSILIRRLVQANLEVEDYEVIEAADGREALDKIRSEKPDLILLDVVMPELDGFEVLQKLRQDSKTADIPVVMLTVRVEEADQIKGWEAGADDYITKPFNPAALVEIVNRVLSQKAQNDHFPSSRVV